MNNRDLKICSTILEIASEISKYIIEVKQIINHQSIKKLKKELNVNQIGQDISRAIYNLEEYEILKVTDDQNGYPKKFKFTTKGEEIKSSVDKLPEFLNKVDTQRNQPLYPIIKETIMGDRNEFHNSQIGAVGSNANSTSNSFQQINYSVPENLDFEKLHKQLGKLKAKLATIACSSEEFKAISEVAEAEEASKQKDGNKVVKHLKDAGKWVFDTAKDIGVEVVAELIKKQMEL